MTAVLSRLDAEQVARQFGLGPVTDTPAFVQRGAMGSIWKLSTESCPWAVKSLYPWTDFDAARHDFEVQKAAAGAGIPLPRPRLALNGEVVGSAGEHRIRVYEWADLTPANTDEPITVHEAEQVGQLLATMHGTPLGPAGGAPGDWYTEPPTTEDWRRLMAVAAASQDAVASSLAARLELLGHLVEVVQSAPELATITCHRDFGRSNVRKATSGSWMVLDWEDAGPLAPERELAGVLHGWCTAKTQTHGEAARAMWAAYSSQARQVPRLERHHFAVRICSHLNFLKGQARAVLDPTTESEHQDYAESAVADLLDSRLPALLPTIDDLIAALT